MLFKLYERRDATYPSLNDPTVSLSDTAAWDAAFGTITRTATGIVVTEAKAMTVPAIWQAVNMITSTFAALPCHLYKSSGTGAEKDIKNPLYYVVHDRPNASQSSAAFWRWFVGRLLLFGRGTALIDKNKTGRARGFIPLDPERLKITQLTIDGSPERTYVYQPTNGEPITYAASEIIDVIWMPQGDGVSHYNPITTNATAIALMLAAEAFASKFFAGGGVPALALTSDVTIKAMSADGAERASHGLIDALKAAARTNSNVLVPPPGHKLEAIGIDPDKSQLLPLRLFSLNEASRIFNIVPALLHDLSKGTYSNFEQQMLYYASQTIHPIARLIEQELNAKLFGQRNNSNYVEFNLDGLLRGDFASRMNGLARAVFSSLLTPNEARALDNRPPMEGGDKLYIQGATVPLDRAGETPAANPSTNDPLADDQPTNDKNKEPNDNG